MSCELCSGGDRWIKTCLTLEGSRLLVCDPCYEEHSSVLVIVPGDRVVTARCDSCGAYGNPREFRAHSPNCSIDKASHSLDYQPRYSSLQAVSEAVEWMIEHEMVETA